VVATRISRRTEVVFADLAQLAETDLLAGLHLLKDRVDARHRE
jgi:hypothetical protein